jgi:hypothetical protein
MPSHEDPGALAGATGVGGQFRELDSAEFRPSNPNSQDLLARSARAYTRLLGRWILPLWGIRDGICTCPEGKDCGRKAGKHPCGVLVPNGLVQATCVPEQAQLWWARAPIANIGMLTGAKNAIDVLDIDDRHGGRESLKALEARHGPLPETVVQRTGGGLHILLQHTPGLRNGIGHNLGQGIDLKAEGGYIVVAPSQHLSGRRYEWDPDHHLARIEVAPAPDWLLSYLTASASERPRARPAQQWIHTIDGPCPEGQRNSTLTSLAGVLFAPGPRNLDVVMALLQQWNLTHCQPPLPAGEVDKVVRSVERIERKRREEEHHGG